MNRRTRFRIFVRDDFTCQYCGKKAPAVELEVDHIHPKSKGGRDTDDNFKTACVACNRGKSNIIVFAPLAPEWTYCNGPKDGQKVRRRDPYPIEWGWITADGRRFWLNDAGVEVDGAWLERVAIGPTPYVRVNHAEADALIDAARSLVETVKGSPTCWIEGAYMSNGVFPWIDYAEMVWTTPSELLSRLDFKHPDESAINAILDP